MEEAAEVEARDESLCIYPALLSASSDQYNALLLCALSHLKVPGYESSFNSRMLEF